MKLQERKYVEEMKDEWEYYVAQMEEMKEEWKYYIATMKQCIELTQKCLLDVAQKGKTMYETLLNKCETKHAKEIEELWKYYENQAKVREDDCKKKMTENLTMQENQIEEQHMMTKIHEVEMKIETKNETEIETKNGIKTEAKIETKNKTTNETKNEMHGRYKHDEEQKPKILSKRE